MVYRAIFSKPDPRTPEKIPLNPFSLSKYLPPAHKIIVYLMFFFLFPTSSVLRQHPQKLGFAIVHRDLAHGEKNYYVRKK